MSALKRLAFADGQITDATEPRHDIQFAGWGLDWIHRHGDGWCCCLDPGTTTAAVALEAAQDGTDGDLLAFLRAAMERQSHQAFPWAVHMRGIRQRVAFREAAK
jgi:hypothetical protein